MNLISFLIIGLIAGWLAGIIMKGKGTGTVTNLILGVTGAVLGGFLFHVLGMPVGGFIQSTVTATVGAAVLLFVVGVLKAA